MPEETPQNLIRVRHIVSPIGQIVSRFYRRVPSIKNYTHLDIFKYGIVCEVSFSGGTIMKTQNRNLMTKNLITAPLDMNLKDAAFLMRTQNIRHLPVVDENDGIVGIFSSKNFPL
ncbi:MAG: CBS domain-containing protein, partial [Pseudobdellovibrionaceae bacterium]